MGLTPESADLTGPRRSTRVDAVGLTLTGVLRELLLLGFAFAAYYAVRLLVRDSGVEPIQNSLALLRLETVLHLNWEMALQRVFLDHMYWLVHVLNFVYAWGYWLVLLGSLAYLYARHRTAYHWLRNAMIVSGLVGFLVFASFPVAPPRLAPVGIVDTVELSSSMVEEVARPSLLTNENAAMPSFHFGWMLLCAICLSAQLERRITRALAALSLPALMGLTIIVTGNHYVIDAIAGGAICLLGLAAAALPRAGYIVVKKRQAPA